ncbi:MAG: transcriptional regulator, LysR family [Clostridiales bacterium]|jgi:DNA-binding transcriptional LysR family regulator|nr:transcriptional regulator, LysR family [Clostridiales bacterium]
MYTLGIETFLAVVRSQSLSKAAEELFLAQSTVSQRIKVLEKEIGITLIERNKGIKQIRLTPSGEEFYRIAEQWSHIWREAMILKEHGPKLSLIVGSVDSINTFLLPRVYTQLSKHYPPIKLTIRTAHSEDLYEEIEKRKVDVAYVLRELVHTNVQVTKCFTSPMVVLRLGNDTSEKKLLHTSDLDPNYELMVPWRGAFKVWHEQWWNPLTSSQIVLDSLHIILSLLQDPRQWTVVPKWIADAAVKRGNYSVYTLVEQPPDMTCYKLTHKQPSSLVVNCINVLDNYFENMVSELI